MQNILLTGAAGFIGARTAEKLLERDHKVIAVDNLSDYYPKNLKEYRLNQLRKNSNFIFFQADIENKNDMEEIFSRHRPQVVFNLAARAGVRGSQKNPQAYFQTNSMGVLNILEIMRKYETRKLILASTSSLYAGEKAPFAESFPANTPFSPYAASKKSAETLAYTYHHLYGIDVSVLRYFTVYGPAGRPDMAPFRFVEWILGGVPIRVFGDGGHSRDFTYIDDIAEGTVLGMKEVGYEIINLGCGANPLSVNNLLELLEELIGKKPTIERSPSLLADMPETCADTTKARQILGWEPKINPTEGFLRTVQWHLENRSWLPAITSASENI